MPQEQEREHGSARRDLVGRAARDEAFRDLLVRDPRAAVQEELGLELPGSVKVVVHENSATEVHVVLPPRLEVSRPVTDDDLRDVAGRPSRGLWKNDTFGMCTNTWC